MLKNNFSDKTLSWMAFGAVALFWGTTFYAIRVGVQTMPPFLMAAIRQFSAGAIIVGYFMFKGNAWPSFNEFKRYAVLGFFMFVLGNGLVSWGIMHVPSGLAAIVCALTPVWMVVINSFGLQKERINIKVGAGFAICFLAQFLIFRNKGIALQDSGFVWGIVFVFVANVAWAYGSIYAKRNKVEIHPMMASGIQMLCGGLMLFIVGTSIGEWQYMQPDISAIYSIIYLIVIGSILSYGCFMYVLKRLPATIVSTYAYINTVVAVMMGWLLLSEPLTIDMFIGVLFTIAGVWMVTRYNKLS
jgi:drug/metabolite transporter (DMT)-like permease